MFLVLHPSSVSIRCSVIIQSILSTVNDDIVKHYRHAQWSCSSQWYFKAFVKGLKNLNSSLIPGRLTDTWVRSTFGLSTETAPSILTRQHHSLNDRACTGRTQGVSGLEQRAAGSAQMSLWPGFKESGSISEPRRTGSPATQHNETQWGRSLVPQGDSWDTAGRKTIVTQLTGKVVRYSLQ